MEGEGAGKVVLARAATKGEERGEARGGQEGSKDDAGKGGGRRPGRGRTWGDEGERAVPHM